MAIVDNSIVSLKPTSTDFTGIGDWTAQPPITGIAYGVGEGGTCSVQWTNGLQSASLPVATLDEITTADTPTQNLFGQVVTIGASSSPNDTCVVVAAYARNDSPQCVLVKSIENGVYREVTADEVSVVAGL